MKYLPLAALVLIVGVAAFGTGYRTGKNGAMGANSGNSGPHTGGGFRAIIVAGSSGQKADWQTLLKSSDELDSNLLAAWARSLPPDEALNIIKSLKGQPTNTRRNDLLGALYAAWAERDPKNFLTGTGDILIPRLRENGVNAALKAWATQDPKDALQWIKDNPGTISAAATTQRFAAAIAGYANTDPAGALAAVSSLNDDNPRDRQLKSAATQALADALAEQGQFAQAAAFFQQLPTGQTRNEAYAQLAQRWTEIAPQDAANWVESLGNDAALKSAMGLEVAKSWAANDPIAAATWAAKVDAQTLATPSTPATNTADDDEPAQGQLLAGTIRAWTNYDLDTAGQFLNQLPATPAKDPAVAIFALRAAQENPAEAFPWVSTITDPQMRDGVTIGLAMMWMQQDQAGFAQFLSTTKILNEQQKQMISDIPPQALQGLSQFNSVMGKDDAMQTMLENAIINGHGLVGSRSPGGNGAPPLSPVPDINPATDMAPNPGTPNPGGN